MATTKTEKFGNALALFGILAIPALVGLVVYINRKKH
jgi:hypothetical protein